MGIEENLPLSEEDIDQYWMQHALDLAKKAESIGEVPVGAVIIQNNELLSEGFNQPIQKHDPTSHAEINALRKAATKINNYRVTGNTTLYVTLEPCVMCAGAIIHARINRVVFAAYDPKTGAAGSAFDLLENEKNNHKPIVKGGVLEDKAANLIRQFFQSRR